MAVGFQFVMFCPHTISQSKSRGATTYTAIDVIDNTICFPARLLIYDGQI